MSAITWAILACGAALMRLGAKPGIERTAYVALFCVCLIIATLLSRYA